MDSSFLIDLIDGIARMNFDEAIDKTTIDLDDVSATWYQRPNAPIWIVEFKDLQNYGIYAILEITWNRGIVGCVLEFGGMSHRRLTRIMDVFLNNLKENHEGQPPLYKIDA
jgi:hypothetical protein